jgi:hypothetical protein
MVALHGVDDLRTRPPEHPLLLLKLYQGLQPGNALPVLLFLTWTLPLALELAMSLFPAGGPKFHGR